MQVWAVIAQKGGQSKTTLSTGFAVEAAREGASVVILDADDRQGSALYWSERRDDDDVMVKDSSVAGLPLHVSRGRSSGKIDLIIIDTPANSKDIAMLAAEQADFVIIPVAPRGLDVHSVLQTVKQVQQAGTPFAVILTQVPHQGGEGQEAHAGFAAKGVTMFDSAAAVANQTVRRADEVGSARAGTGSVSVWLSGIEGVLPESAHRYREATVLLDGARAR